MLFNYIDDPDGFYEYINSEDALFHYTNKTIAIEHILKKKQLKFGRLADSSDPKEYSSPIPSYYLPPNTGSNITPKAVFEVDNIYDSHIGFISFCKNEHFNGVIQNNGCIKPRMWSQYGDKQKGACIVISKNKLIETLSSFDTNNFIIRHNSITYEMRDNEDRTMRLSKDDIENKDYKGVALKYILDKEKSYFFSKQNDYRDENEYRIIAINKNSYIGDLFVDISNSIKAVVFGDKFPTMYAPTVNDMIKNTDIKSKKLLCNRDIYHLDNLNLFHTIGYN